MLREELDSRDQDVSLLREDMQEMSQSMNQSIKNLLSLSEIASLIHKSESDVATVLQSGDVGNAENVPEVDFKKDYKRLEELNSRFTKLRFRNSRQEILL